MKKKLLPILFLLFSSAAFAQKAKTHVVQRGETLESVAGKYGVSPDALKAANPNMNNLFYGGMVLNIPQPSQPVISSVKQDPVSPAQKVTATANPSAVAPATVLPALPSSEQTLPQASSTFVPQPTMSANEIVRRVNQALPFMAFVKGQMAEYCLSSGDNQTQFWSGEGPTYIQQTVADTRVEGGLYVVLLNYSWYNKKHERWKGVLGVPKKFKEQLFSVEIDIAGNYHFAHNFTLSGPFIIRERKGYGFVVPGVMQAGTMLKCSTVQETRSGGLFKTKGKMTYTNWQVVGQETITTPAGTFDCVRLEGNIQSASKGNDEKQETPDRITCWMARCVGIVRYDINGTESVYLNKLEQLTTF